MSNITRRRSGLLMVSQAPMFGDYIEAFDSNLPDVVQFTGIAILVLGFSNFIWYVKQWRKSKLLLTTSGCQFRHVLEDALSWLYRLWSVSVAVSGERKPIRTTASWVLACKNPERPCYESCCVADLNQPLLPPLEHHLRTQPFPKLVLWCHQLRFRLSLHLSQSPMMTIVDRWFMYIVSCSPFLYIYKLHINSRIKASSPLPVTRFTCTEFYACNDFLSLDYYNYYFLLELSPPLSVSTRYLFSLPRCSCIVTTSMLGSWRGKSGSWQVWGILQTRSQSNNLYLIWNSQ